MPVPVDRALVGHVDSPVSPAAGPERLGTVRLEQVRADGTVGPPGPLTVRDHVELRLVHEVGQHGMDDRGAIKVVFRFPADGGDWQVGDPTARNFVSVRASRPGPAPESAAPCGFRLRFEAYGHARPWFKVLTVQVIDGCLREGDRVELTLGDRSGGGPGLRLQTFCERAWELRFLVDPCATGHFVEVPGSLAVAIGPDLPDRWRLVGPTRWPAGVPFRLGVVCEDRWGNPTDRADADLVFAADPPLVGLAPLAVRSGSFAPPLDALVAARPGVTRVRCLRDGVEVARCALRITDGEPLRSWWGDLHGQSGETVGINSAEDYFTFARDRAFLDATSHQANDFQINDALWARINELTAAFDEPGRFVAVPGYEWSGNTAVGGDRNVFFRREGRPIRRSSHALLLERADLGTDCTTARALFDALRTEDAVVYAHVGGRWADLREAHDGRTERAVEIHSDWGTFEWLVEDAFALGHRVGVVANSDGHKGRPGASWPGAATFGALGGLTCFFAPALSRDDLFAAIRARRTLATTGTRLDLQVCASLPEPGWLHDDDPALGPCGGRPAAELRTGDIATTGAEVVRVAVSVVAGAPVDHLEVRVGPRVVHTWRRSEVDPDPRAFRVRVEWRGARYRGRGREARWDGDLAVTGARLVHVTRINAFNPDHAFSFDASGARWEAITTGNFGGLDLWLEDVEPGARLVVRTARGGLEAALAELDAAGRTVPCGGLGLALGARRLAAGNPDALELEVPVALGEGDTPVWVCVTLEDGHQAWSSPVTLVRGRRA